MDEKEEEEMVTVVEKGGQGDVEEEDFILREQVNSLKLQVTRMRQEQLLFNCWGDPVSNIQIMKLFLQIREIDPYIKKNSPDWRS